MHEELTLEGETAVFTFQVPGVYTVTLTVEDAMGLTDDSSFDVRVRDTVAPTPPKLRDLEAGAGDSVRFDGSGAADNVGVVEWRWTFREGGKTVTLEGERVDHAFDEAGDYEVTLTVVDADGNEATGTFTVTVTGGGWLWIFLVVIAVVVVVGAIVLIRRSRD